MDPPRSAAATGAKGKGAPKARIEPLPLVVEAGDALGTSCRRAAEHLGMCSLSLQSAALVVLSCRSYREVLLFKKEKMFRLHKK